MGHVYARMAVAVAIFIIIDLLPVLYATLVVALGLDLPIILILYPLPVFFPVHDVFLCFK